MAIQNRKLFGPHQRKTGRTHVEGSVLDGGEPREGRDRCVILDCGTAECELERARQ